MPHFPKPFFKKARRTWYVQLDGTQVNLGPDRQQAFARYHELMRTPCSRSVSPHSVESLADAFLEWLRQHRSEDTFEWYRYRLERFCRRYPDLRTGDLKPFHVQRWVDSYPQLKRTSKRNYVRSVKRCLHWAVQQGYIASSPIDQLEVPGADRRETLVTVEEYEQLLAAARDAAFRDLIITTWETGCRPQESLRVEARHVDLKHQRWVFPKSESKGQRQPRVIYLSESALEITRRRMDMFPTGPLFRNSCGKPWSTDAVNNAFDRLRVKLLQSAGLVNVQQIEEAIARLLPTLKTERLVEGRSVARSPRQLNAEARRKVLAQFCKTHIPRYSLYALRHAWATRAIQRDVDPLTVAILMGHSDPSTLSRVYQHVALNPAHMLQQAKRAAQG